MLPIVAIIGKPNVGKSTLFNRLTGSTKAITSPVAGTTRDRHYVEVTGRKPFLLVDTGGIQSKTEGDIENNVVAQASVAVTEAELILFVVNAQEGLTADDYFVAQILRKSTKEVLLIASKCDSGAEELSEIFRLGFGEPLPVSAVHKLGVSHLETAIRKKIPAPGERKKKAATNIRLAILGRPNVGKSSLINALVGSKRFIVSDVPGTTVDSADVELLHEGQHFTLADTAGIRRRGSREKGIEKYSFLRSLQACEQADVCVLVIDGVEGPTAQDQHVAQYILEHYSGLILAINKFDVMERSEKDRIRFLDLLHHKFSFVPWAPAVFVSAKEGTNIGKILELAKEIHERRAHRVSTPIMNRWLQKVIFKHMPTGTGLITPKVFFCTQVDTRPPHFIISINNEKYFHFSYRRYLENELRSTFGFEGTAVKIEFKNKKRLRVQKP